jgi:transposase
MLSWPPTVKILLGAGPTDMRKGFDSLAHLVESSMALDPLSGHLFVFRSRRGDRVKILILGQGRLRPLVQTTREGLVPLPDRGGGGRDEGCRGQGGGPDDDPRRGRPGQRPSTAAILPGNRRKSLMKALFEVVGCRTILA